MGKRIAILLGAFFLMHFIVFVGANFCLQTGAIHIPASTVEKILTARANKAKKNATLLTASDFNRIQFRTRIWTQFFLFDVPQTPEFSLLAIFIEKYSEGDIPPFTGKTSHNFFTLRGPPAVC